MQTRHSDHFLNLSALLLAIVLIAAGVFYGGEGINLSDRVQANAIDHNVSGFAWAGDDMGDADPATLGGLGWISFNCKDSSGASTQDTCPPALGGVDYGVNIENDPGSNRGLFSGNAWSSNIGWISFNVSSLGGCSSPPCEARLNPDNTVSGWARACVVYQNVGDCNGALKASSSLGGWDGWIRLRGTSPNYGVYLDPVDSKLKGYAWGGGPLGDNTNFVGWIDFNPTGAGVIVNLPPDVELTADNVNPIWNTNVNLSWTVFGGAAECHRYGGDYGWETPSSKSVSGGSEQVGPIVTQSSFSIECTKPNPLGGQFTDISSVIITPQTPFTLAASATTPPTSPSAPANLQNNRQFATTITVIPQGGFAGDVTFGNNYTVRTNTGAVVSGAAITFSEDPLTSALYSSGSVATIVLPVNTPSASYIEVLITGTSGGMSATTPPIRIYTGGSTFKAPVKFEEV